MQKWHFLALELNLMRTIKLFICFFILISWGVKAQETDFSTEVSSYLDSNGTMKQYQYAYDELLKMLAKQYPKSATTADGWAYLEGNKENAIAAMKQELIPIYQENFSASEIKLMTAFYQSDTGKQLIGDRSKMTDVQKEELNSFYGTVVGRKIIEKQPVLTQAISVVSESWSRDLYETAVSLLKE